jgi:hypothetical protein
VNTSSVERPGFLPLKTAGKRGHSTVAQLWRTRTRSPPAADRYQSSIGSKGSLCRTSRVRFLLPLAVSWSSRTNFVPRPCPSRVTLGWSASVDRRVHSSASRQSIPVSGVRFGRARRRVVDDEPGSSRCDGLENRWTGDPGPEGSNPLQAPTGASQPHGPATPSRILAAVTRNVGRRHPGALPLIRS